LASKSTVVIGRESEVSTKAEPGNATIKDEPSSAEPKLEVLTNVKEEDSGDECDAGMRESIEPLKP